MAKEGLFARLCAGAVLGALSLIPVSVTTAGDNRDTALANTLAVQTALQQGSELVLRGNYRAAVYVLESQISRIDGSREYLAVLRDAYRGHVRELRLANQEEEAQTYQRRLQAIDPGAVLDLASAGTGAPPPRTAPPPAKSATATAPNPADPFDEFSARQAQARAAIAQADLEFSHRRFDAASRLYAEAHQADADSTAASADRWAYCKLFDVVQRLNQPPAKDPSYLDMEQEVRRAMSLAPRMDNFGQEVLRKIAERRTAPTTGAAVSVRHGERTAEGWQTAQTANFRILHNQAKELAERTAEVAERTRTEMSRKWLGELDATWPQRCDIYLHATAQEYGRATGVRADSPGHSTFHIEAGRVLSRRIDLHCDDPNMLTAVLPHEATHVILAGKFGERPVPRWVDEGIAVLSEPRDKVERHLRNLPQHLQNQQLFPMKQLMQLDDYPEPRAIAVFYAQSVSLVEFLAAQKGPETFTRFVREGMRGGYQPALKRYYGFQDFTDLEQQWRRYAFKDGASSGQLADRPR